MIKSFCCAGNSRQTWGGGGGGRQWTNAYTTATWVGCPGGTEGASGCSRGTERNQQENSSIDQEIWVRGLLRMSTNICIPTSFSPLIPSSLLPPLYSPPLPSPCSLQPKGLGRKEKAYSVPNKREGGMVGKLAKEFETRWPISLLLKLLSQL